MTMGVIVARDSRLAAPIPLGARGFEGEGGVAELEEFGVDVRTRRGAD